MKSIGKRIKDLRLMAGLNQIELAQKVGVNQSTISKLEKDKDVPGATTLQNLAVALGVDTAKIMGFGDTAQEAGRRVRVMGALQAGAFEETIEFSHDDQYDVSVQLDDDLDGIPLQGFEVRGDSMNKFYPDGSKVYVAPVHAVPPVNGDHVMVMRRQKDGTVEGTLKEYVVNDSGKWLVPQSTSMEHQTPIDYRKGRKGNVEEVIITGVVVAALVRRPVRSIGG